MYTVKRHIEYDFVQGMVLEKTDDVILCRWDASFGRMGSLEGLFFTTRADVEKLQSETVNFGEVLGKHSDVEYDIHEDDFEFIELDSNAVSIIFDKLAGEDGTISGYNPIATYLLYEAENPTEED